MEHSKQKPLVYSRNVESRYNIGDEVGIATNVNTKEDFFTAGYVFGKIEGIRFHVTKMHREEVHYVSYDIVDTGGKLHTQIGESLIIPMDKVMSVLTKEMEMKFGDNHE